MTVSIQSLWFSLAAYIIAVSYIIINSNKLANLKFVYLQKELIYLITDEHNWINLNHIWTHVLRQKFRTTQEN